MIGDKPIGDIARQIGDIAFIQGDAFQFFQKFTCQHCGSRQTMAEKNQLFAHGKCEECGQITEIKECGFTAILGAP